MKVLFFTRYTRKGASSRLRFYQYIPYFESKGVKCDISPLFDDKYLIDLYGTKKVSLIHILRRYALQFLKLFQVYKYDIIVIEKELFPYVPALFEWLLAKFGVKYIVDYDDAIFHNYDLHPNRLVRIFLSNKIAQVMRFSAAVVAGNDYLNNYSSKSGAKNIVIIPTVVDTSKYSTKLLHSTKEVIIGWIGSPSTLKYVEMLKPILQEISKIYPIKLYIIGGNSGIGLGEIETILKWSEKHEADQIKQFNIGIMPLYDELWEYGKCGYKLIQYMACGIPVIGSPIGVNNIIIRDGVNGYKALDINSWKEALCKLIQSESLRQKMGNQGRKIVEAEYSLIKASNNWLHLLRGTLR